MRAYPRGDIYSPLINDPLSKVGGINRARNQIAVINYSALEQHFVLRRSARRLSRSDEIARRKRATKTRVPPSASRRCSSRDRSFHVRARGIPWDCSDKLSPALDCTLDYPIKNGIITHAAAMRAALNELVETTDRSTDRGCSCLPTK